MKEKEQFERLSKLSKKYRTGKLPPVDWLDRLTFSEIERINQKESDFKLHRIFIGREGGCSCMSSPPEHSFMKKKKHKSCNNNSGVFVSPHCENC